MSNLSFEEISCIYQKLAKKKNKETKKDSNTDKPDEFFTL